MLQLLTAAACIQTNAIHVMCWDIFMSFCFQDFVLICDLWVIYFNVILFQLNLEPSGKLRVIIELNGQMNEGRLLFKKI